MSVITVLMRLDPGKLELYRKNPDELFKHGAESIDIGKLVLGSCGCSLEFQLKVGARKLR